MVERQHFAQRWDKLTEAVIHLSQRSTDDPDFGETKLVKLLYYADCAAYEQGGAPITGTTYLHFPHGPFPENWYDVKDRMEADNAISVMEETTPDGYTRKRTLANRSVKPGVLSEAEISILDEQLEQFTGFNGSELAAFSHREIGWRMTTDREPIPYEVSKFSAPVPDEFLMKEARRIADEYAQRRANLHGH